MKLEDFETPKRDEPINKVFVIVTILLLLLTPIIVGLMYSEEIPLPEAHTYQTATSEINTEELSSAVNRYNSELSVEQPTPTWQGEPQEGVYDLEYIGNYEVHLYCPCNKCSMQWVDNLRTSTGESDPINLCGVSMIYVEGYGRITPDDMGWVASGSKLHIMVANHGQAGGLPYTAAVYLMREMD